MVDRDSSPRKQWQREQKSGPVSDGIELKVPQSNLTSIEDSIKRMAEGKMVFNPGAKDANRNSAELRALFAKALGTLGYTDSDLSKATGQFQIDRKASLPRSFKANGQPDQLIGSETLKALLLQEEARQVIQGTHVKSATATLAEQNDLQQTVGDLKKVNLQIPTLDALDARLLEIKQREAEKQTISVSDAKTLSYIREFNTFARELGEHYELARSSITGRVLKHEIPLMKERLGKQIEVATPQQKERLSQLQTKLDNLETSYRNLADEDALREKVQANLGLVGLMVAKSPAEPDSIQTENELKAFLDNAKEKALGPYLKLQLQQKEIEQGIAVS